MTKLIKKYEHPNETIHRRYAWGKMPLNTQRTYTDKLTGKEVLAGDYVIVDPKSGIILTDSNNPNLFPDLTAAGLYPGRFEVDLPEVGTTAEANPNKPILLEATKTPPPLRRKPGLMEDNPEWQEWRQNLIAQDILIDKERELVRKNNKMLDHLFVTLPAALTLAPIVGYELAAAAPTAYQWLTTNPVGQNLTKDILQAAAFGLGIDESIRLGSGHQYNGWGDYMHKTTGTGSEFLWGLSNPGYIANEGTYLLGKGLVKATENLGKEFLKLNNIDSELLTNTVSKPLQNLVDSYKIVIPKYYQQVKAFDGAKKLTRGLQGASSILNPRVAKTLASNQDLMEITPIYGYNNFSQKLWKTFANRWNAEASKGSYSLEGLLQHATPATEESELQSMFADARNLQHYINESEKLAVEKANEYFKKLSEITDPDLRHIVKESPLYLDEVYENRFVTGENKVLFIKDLIKKANSYRRYMHGDIKPEDFSTFGSKDKSGVGHPGKIHVEGSQRSDPDSHRYYGTQVAYYQGLPDLNVPVSELWDHRIPEGVVVKLGMHSRDIPELLELANSVKSGDARSVLKHFYNTYLKLGAPSEYVHIPYHLYFEGEPNSQLLNFKVTVGEMPSDFTFGKGYGLEPKWIYNRNTGEWDISYPKGLRRLWADEAKNDVILYYDSDFEYNRLLESGATPEQAQKIMATRQTNAKNANVTFRNLRDGVYGDSKNVNGQAIIRLNQRPHGRVILYDPETTKHTMYHELGGHGSSLNIGEHAVTIPEDQVNVLTEIYKHNEGLRPELKPFYQAVKDGNFELAKQLAPEEVLKNPNGEINFEEIQRLIKYFEENLEYSARARGKNIADWAGLKNGWNIKLLREYFTDESVDKLLKNVWSIIPITAAPKILDNTTLEKYLKGGKLIPRKTISKK